MVALDCARRARCGHGDRGFEGRRDAGSIDLGAASVVVRLPFREFNAQLRPALPRPLQAGDSGFADGVALLPGRPGAWGPQVCLWSRPLPLRPYPLGSALPFSNGAPTELLAQRLNAHVLLHAGVVAREDRALILPAAPGSGKSTLTCALHLAGWRPDEFGGAGIPESDRCTPAQARSAGKNRLIDIIGGQPGAVPAPSLLVRAGRRGALAPDRASVAAAGRSHPRPWCS